MIKLGDIFNIEYPKTTIFFSQLEDKKGINFISSKGKNNGVVGRVKINPLLKVFKKGSITVPLKGTVLHASLQNEDFHCAHQIAVLYPKNNINLNENEKIFYCTCIKLNKFRFNYGRQADRSLKDIKVPNIKEIPKWVNKLKFNKLNKFEKPYDNLKKSIKLSTKDWKAFFYKDLFFIERGKGPRKMEIKNIGKTPVVTSSDQNNGWSHFSNAEPTHKSKTIGVNRIGTVAHAFYQPLPFTSSENVHIFTPKFKMNKYLAMFIVTLIKLEKDRFHYGRTWSIPRMENSIIKLPYDYKKKEIDFKFIEKFIKSLKYSISI